MKLIRSYGDKNHILKVPGTFGNKASRFFEKKGWNRKKNKTSNTTGINEHWKEKRAKNRTGREEKKEQRLPRVVRKYFLHFHSYVFQANAANEERKRIVVISQNLKESNSKETISSSKEIPLKESSSKETIPVCFCFFF